VSLSFALAAALAAAPSPQDEGASVAEDVVHGDAPIAPVEVPAEGAPTDAPAPASPPSSALPAKPRAPRRAPPREAAHEVPIPLVAEGVTVTGTIVEKKGQRYRIFADAKGTVLIAVDSIHGPAPNVKLMNAEGKTIRRGVRGKSFARPNPGDELVLEITPPYKDAASTYQLSVAFEVDRPRHLRHLPRPLRPRDIVRVVGGAAPDLDQVTVGGLPADYAIHGADVLVTIPGFARSGEIELRYETRPVKTMRVELIGTSDAVDRMGECSGTGCLSFTLSPSVGPKWLDAIAKLLDADVRKHVIRTGSVVVKLRLPSSESYAIEQLRRMGSVSSAQRAAQSEVTQAPLSP
jgi:hypothetical protein